MFNFWVTVKVGEVYRTIDFNGVNIPLLLSLLAHLEAGSMEWIHGMYFDDTCDLNEFEQGHLWVLLDLMRMYR